MARAFTDGDRYKFSVLEIAQNLAGESSGSGSFFPYDETGKTIVDAIEWLEWRVGDGWIETKIERMRSYDDAVRAVGLAAVALGKNTVSPPTGRPETGVDWRQDDDHAMDDLEKSAQPKHRKHGYFAARLRASGTPVMCRIDLCDYGGMLNLCAATDWNDVTDEDGEPTGDLSGDFLPVNSSDLDTESVIWSIWALEVYGG